MSMVVLFINELFLFFKYFRQSIKQQTYVYFITELSLSFAIQSGGTDVT